MKRLVTPFSFGLSLGLLVVLACALVPAFSVYRVWALSNKGPDTVTDFPPNVAAGAFYTLSATVDVANTTSMGLVVYHSGAKPGAVVTVTVTYQSGAGQCSNQNDQGSAGATFSYGSGAGSPVRNTSIAIPTAAWASDGVGYTADLTASIVNVSNGCGDGDHVNFRLTAPSGYIIGPDNSKNFAIAQGSYCVTYNSTYPSGVSCNGYTAYNIPFAPDCTVNTNGSAAAKIIDMDNTGHPVIQPTEAIVKVIDTTTGGVVNNNVFSGSEANGGTATFTFPYTAHHNYKLQIGGYSGNPNNGDVNLNNVLQIQLPFDSVNAQINCLPVGGITSSASAACTTLTGWMYDTGSPATALQYYVYVNPGSTPASSYASAPADSHFVGPFTAGDPNPSPGTPAGTPANHGFTVDIPADVTGHGYNGPWGADTYYVYAQDATSATLQQVASKNVPVGTCASVTCGATSTFALVAVGIPIQFQVYMNLQDSQVPFTPPPGNPTFNVTVTGVGSGTNSQNYPAVAAQAPSGGTVYSTNIPFTPTGAGTYNVTWTYFGQGGCGDSDDAGFAPFFQSLGGDTAAGTGFGDSCNENNSADIKSWNLNTDAAPNYYGAGSEIGAWATGNITDFVSGMGLTGGAASGSGYGLSLANSSNVSGGGYGGQFGTNAVPCMPDYYAAKPTGISSVGPLVTSLPAASGSYNGTVDGSSKLTLGGAPGSTLFLGQVGGVGEQVSIYVTGNVYITSNIEYSAYTSLAKIPRFNLYVKGNIYIDPHVTELHGVYIAQDSSPGSGGQITTCEPGVTSAQQTYATCNSQLKFVGAVAAETAVRMNRTYGSLVTALGAPNQPAEIFQYGPELWAGSPSGNGFAYQSYTSLPPVL